MTKEIKLWYDFKKERLETLKSKYVKARNQLIRFNKTIINNLGAESIRESSEFFDCEITLIEMLDKKISIIEANIEDIHACNLTGLETELTRKGIK